MYDVYQAQIKYVDRIVSQWLTQAAATLSDSPVVVIGDHGQLFGEEGMVGHHTSMHPAGIGVPVFLSFPDE